MDGGTRNPMPGRGLTAPRARTWWTGGGRRKGTPLATQQVDRRRNRPGVEALERRHLLPRISFVGGTWTIAGTPRPGHDHRRPGCRAPRTAAPGFVNGRPIGIREAAGAFAGDPPGGPGVTTRSRWTEPGDHRDQLGPQGWCRQGHAGRRVGPDHARWRSRQAEPAPAGDRVDDHAPGRGGHSARPFGSLEAFRQFLIRSAANLGNTRAMLKSPYSGTVPAHPPRRRRRPPTGRTRRRRAGTGRRRGGRRRDRRLVPLSPVPGRARHRRRARPDAPAVASRTAIDGRPWRSTSTGIA